MTLGTPDLPVTDEPVWLPNKVKARLGNRVNKVLMAAIDARAIRPYRLQGLR